MKLSRITCIYDRIKRRANAAFGNGDYERALREVALAAELAYNFNWIYADDELERMVGQIAHRAVPEPAGYAPVEGRMVFFDSFGWANRGLTQQYIRGLMSRGVELLFVYDGANAASTTAIVAELEAYGKAEFYAVDAALPWIEQIRVLREKIASFAPDKAFIHITPWDVVAVAVWHLLPATTRYWVNLTDHAFWLGVHCLDYSLEFRTYGCTVSRQKRSLKTEQLLIAPYYPILDCKPFAGFPPEVTAQSVVVFTGGNFYKMYSRGQLFLNLLKRLVETDERVVVLIAGNGNDKPLKRFIKGHRLEKRLLLIGTRNDINHVFAHSDICLGTYPLTGGLMAQFAAANRKPILAYTNAGRSCNYISSLLSWGIEPMEEVTSTTEEEFTRRARRLIADEEYRRSEGEKGFEHLITPAEFNSHLFRLIASNSNERPIREEAIDYADFTSLYLDIQNYSINLVGELLWRSYGWRSVGLAPRTVMRHIISAVKRKFTIFR